MKIVFWGKGQRAASCLQALYNNGHKPELIVVQPLQETDKCGPIVKLAKQLGIETIEPAKPNDRQIEQQLSRLQPDLFILAGYGKILKQNIIDLPKKMCINLHGGRLPQYRGSSPMNWALINGETSFTLSIIKVNAGVDTGEILCERSFAISIDDTIRDLHNIANREFPLMLIEVIRQIVEGGYVLKSQDAAAARYYPLRFPEDGLILWDIYTAAQIHNRIRALTKPYPCAFTFFNNRKVQLLSSQLCRSNYLGEPGRIYQKNDRRLLICALDKCLWITDAVFTDNGQPLYQAVNRYDRLSAVRWSLARA